MIGAHIGVHVLNEIEEYKKEKILLVEPVPHNLKALRVNIPNYQTITIEPITIGESNETRSFYFVKHNSIDKLGKHWASGIGSFDKQHILNHKTKRFKIEEEDIESVKIKSLTFNDLMNKHKISEILFEYKHFDGTFNKGDKLELIKKKLISKNFKLNQIDKENILAKKS